MSIPLLYLTFAAIATIVNLLIQEVALAWQGDGTSIFVPMLLGTIIGLVTKYLLDQNYIFKYCTTSKRKSTQTFCLYSLMGVLTTFIFWGIEWGVYFIFETNIMRNVGAVIGLSISYLIKYQLDKNYVFISPQKIEA